MSLGFDIKNFYFLFFFLFSLSCTDQQRESLFFGNHEAMKVRSWNLSLSELASEEIDFRKKCENNNISDLVSDYCLSYHKKIQPPYYFPFKVNPKTELGASLWQLFFRKYGFYSGASPLAEPEYKSLDIRVDVSSPIFISKQSLYFDFVISNLSSSSTLVKNSDFSLISRPSAPKACAGIKMDSLEYLKQPKVAELDSLALAAFSKGFNLPESCELDDFTLLFRGTELRIPR